MTLFMETLPRQICRRLKPCNCGCQGRDHRAKVTRTVYYATSLEAAPVDPEATQYVTRDAAKGIIKTSGQFFKVVRSDMYWKGKVVQRTWFIQGVLQGGTVLEALTDPDF